MMNVGTAEDNLCREKSLEPTLPRRIILCVVQALSCSTAAALDSMRRISQYGHRTWRMQDAYLPGPPEDIAQTKDGYLWIGTDAGLVRFGGVRFVPWDSPNGEQLPRYQTTWFLALCAISVLAGFYLLYLARLRQVASQMQKRMEVQHAERERIARDLHDALLQSVQGLILKFHEVAKQIPGEAPARQAIEKTLAFDQALAEGRDRVRNLRASTVGVGELPRAFQQVVKEAAPNRSSTVKAVFEGAVLELHLIIREETYCIGREALSNALTHSEACSIGAEITYDSRTFRLRIRDDGRGIDPEVLEKGGRTDHWDLQGMRERAERIGAKLDL